MMIGLAAFLIPLGCFAVVRLLERTGHSWMFATPAYAGLVASVLGILMVFAVRLFGASMSFGMLNALLGWGMLLLVGAVTLAVLSALWLSLKSWPVADQPPQG